MIDCLFVCLFVCVCLCGICESLACVRACLLVFVVGVTASMLFFLKVLLFIAIYSYDACRTNTLHSGIRVMRCVLALHITWRSKVSLESHNLRCD